jgi:hypothetical protein
MEWLDLSKVKVYIATATTSESNPGTECIVQGESKRFVWDGLNANRDMGLGTSFAIDEFVGCYET